MRKILFTIALIMVAMIAPAQENPMEGLCFNPDKPAEFPGGKVAMGQYFSENLEYPTDALIEGIEGRVMCQFIIQPDSSRTNINIVRKVHPSIDAEMRRLVENMPQWTPATKDGIPVKTLVTLPLMFKLPENIDINEGTLPGIFTVSADKKIRFSKGNLQYLAENHTWRFAENQWEILNLKSANNNNINTWCDLIAWGRSGYQEYYPEISDKYFLEGKNSITNTDYEWGHYNAITNGGNLAGLWTTLTKDEWNYIFTIRENAINLLALGSVAGVYGIILLPDNYWDNPINHFFQTSSQQELMPHYSGNDIYFSTERKLSMLQNNFTKETWKKFEEAGAIFLPTSNYWTSSVNEPKTRLNKDNVLQSLNERYIDYVSLYPMIKFNTTNGFSNTAINSFSIRLVKIEPTNNIDIYEDFDIAPQYKGGENALQKYLKHNLYYPKHSYLNSIEGVVLCEFIVKKDGYIQNIKIINGINSELDSEAIRIIKNMPKWTSATKKGEKVNAKIQLPIKFELTNEDKEQITIANNNLKKEQEKETITFPDASTYCIDEGTLKGIFSVSPNKKIHFSQGNLQYQASTHTWRFASQQWETLGVENRTDFDKADMTKWIDLFWIGSSGYKDYYPELRDEEVDFIRIEKDSNYDWGIYNAILNGGNQAGLWRTLTNEEWHYLFYERPNAYNLFGFIKLEGIKGLVLLPDNYLEIVNDTSLYPTMYELQNKGKYYYNKDENNLDEAKHITYEQWFKMQEYGAVFLSVIGSNIDIMGFGEWKGQRHVLNTFDDRQGVGVNLKHSNNQSIDLEVYTINDGMYWAMSRHGLEFYCLHFNNGYIWPQNTKENIYKLAVRLVKDIK